ncbi:MAG TPA: sulfite exporter TauE/SafE family protein [Pirellulales bacterium]|nr:sulfite exporter TauE/SafE family protein [Pirellulales bacterium]
MNVVELTSLVFGGSVLAGFLGALTGLGGGVVIVPMLALAFGIDMRYAIGASLVSVIATSSGAASAYVKEGYANIRIGMLLEVATTIGALGGAIAASFVSTSILAVVFGVVLLYSAYASLRSRSGDGGATEVNPLAARWKLDGNFPTPSGRVSYHVTHLPGGFAVMFLAGLLSGLLGIGSGAVKVLAMDQIMRIPFKVSTTTSNFMIGVTAAASAGIYFGRGYIDPGLAMPVVLGVGLGALVGAKVLVWADAGRLRLAFGVVVAALAIEMIYSGLAGKL